jgi:hypothetical protein
MSSLFFSFSHKQFFRRAKEFFDQPQIEIAGGLSFTKSANRDARSMNVDTSAVESANTVENREEALENYVVERTQNFFQERSLNLDMASAARSLSGVIPEEVKTQMRSLATEARGKKKKILKALMPILGLLKLKIVGLAILALLGIALIAKKALIVSVIALILSKFLFIKKLLSKGKDEGHATAYQAGGWDTSSYGDYSGSHSQPAHSIAYAGHKPVRK